MTYIKDFLGGMNMRLDANVSGVRPEYTTTATGLANLGVSAYGVPSEPRKRNIVQLVLGTKWYDVD